MQTHEACRAIVSAVQALQAEPLTHKGKELLSVIARNANEAAEEIEYLQTAASTFRPVEKHTLPNAYEACRLTTRERDILTILHRAQGRPVSRAFIFDEIYGANSSRQEKTLDVLVKLIRDKIHPNTTELHAEGHPTIIETIWGVGWRLVPKTKLNATTRGRTGRYRDMLAKLRQKAPVPA